MADNYLQFSAILNLYSEAERDWWRNKIEELSRSDEDAACAMEIDDDGNLWCYDESCGDPGRLGDTVQEFFQAFPDPPRCFGLSYANTCSRPKLDEFGGGVLFVTAAEVIVTDASIMLVKLEQEFAAKHSATLGDKDGG